MTTTLTKILNKLVEVFGAGDGFEVAEEEGEGFFGHHEVDDFDVFSALVDFFFGELLVVVGAEGALGFGEEFVDAGGAEGAAALVEDQRDALFNVKGLLALVAEQNVIHLFIFQSSDLDFKWWKLLLFW